MMVSNSGVARIVCVVCLLAACWIDPAIAQPDLSLIHI